MTTLADMLSRRIAAPAVKAPKALPPPPNPKPTNALVLTIDMDSHVVSLSDDPKYAGFTFVNPEDTKNPGQAQRFAKVTATDQEGNVWKLSALFLPPSKASNAKAEARELSEREAALNEREARLAQLEARLAQVEAKASAPLKSGRKGIAAPATSVLVPAK